MLVKLFRSILIGVIVAALLLLALPTLRTNIALFQGGNDTSDASAASAPLSYYHGVQRAAPAVVNVYNRVPNPEQPNELNVQTLGSGVIMSEKGYILTNKHVINDAQQILVALQDGRLFEAIVVGSDSLTDLAVLQIDGVNLPVIPINSNRTARIGDVVMAIGNPYNLGQTITQGIISATGRVGLSAAGEDNRQNGRQNLLQTDASINRGNSGGALVNTLGELVGINTLSFDKSSDGETPEGISFAIPVALATKVMGKLIRDGRVIRGYIGVNGIQMESIGKKNVGQGRLSGILIKTVDPGGPADKAGVHVDDILLSVNHKPTRSVIETMDQVAELRPGTVIPIVIERDKKSITLNMTIQEFPVN